jgi:uncharacterized protein YqjF (DUF2071 family)
MKRPSVRGTIDRRLLVNFAVDPEVVARVLPQPFRPKVIHDHAVAGICLIRLRDVRPAGLPASFGVTSENAAHRIAVVWDEGHQQQEGVFIPRRDTSSRLNTMVGGRLFPGAHHHASFEIKESEPHYRVGFQSRDGATYALVSGHATDDLPTGSIFSSLEEVSSFFQEGSVGYSATADPERFDGLELRTQTWQLRPLEVEEVHSSFFDDISRFLPGTARFDNALIMNRIEHEWRALRPMRIESPRYESS